MADKITLIKEETFDVMGATKISVGDPAYFEEMEAGCTNLNLKKLTYNGPILGAPLSKMKIQLNRVEYESEWGNGDYENIDVFINQAATDKVLDLYMNNKYYPALVREEHDLGCDTARFILETKTPKGINYDEFHTGADGYYGSFIKMKRGYGMMMTLSFDASLFTYDEIKRRMLRLFPERR